MANAFGKREQYRTSEGKSDRLDDITRRVLNTQHEAETVGEGDDVKALHKLSMKTGMDSPAVQAYVMQAINLVKKYSANAGDLKQLLPLFDELMREVKEDMTLDPKYGARAGEKEHILKVLADLRRFVTKKVTIDNKISTRLKNVAKAKVSAWKERASENLKDSPSVLFRLAGRALSGRQKTEGGATEAQADVAGETARVARLAASRAGWQDPALGGEDSMMPSNRPARARESGASGGPGAALGTGAGVLLGKILGTDTQILGEVKEVKQTLVGAKEQDAEQYELDSKERERAADNMKGEKKDNLFGRLAALLGGKKKEGEAGPQKGLFDRIFGGMADALKTAMLLRLVPGLKAIFTGLGAVFSSIASSIGTILKGALRAVMSGGAGSLAAFLGGAAIGAKYFDSMLGLIGKEAYATGQVFRDAQTAGLTIGNRGANELTERLATYHEQLDAGKSQEEARKIADDPAALAKKSAPPAPPAAAAKPTSPPALASRSVGNAVGVLPSGAGSSIDLTPQVSSTGMASLRLQETLTSVGPTTTSNTPARVTESPSGNLKMSEQGLKLLGQREGYPKDAKGNAVAYPDAGGVWTIGRGITRINGKPVTQGMTLSKGEEESEFRKQVETKYAQMVRVSLAGAPISQNQFDALVSLAYNHERSGKAAAAKFASGQQLTPEDFTRTATVKGQPHAGLQARRLGEYNQFQGVSFQPRASGARSGAVLASATTAAGGGRSAGAPPTVIVNAPVSTIAQGAAPAVIPIPLRVDPLDATVRAIRNTSGSVLG